MTEEKVRYYYYTNGNLTIRAQLEDDGYYHLYCHQLGYLDQYSEDKQIKRFRSLKAGRRMVKRFLKNYIKSLQDELANIADPSKIPPSYL